VQPEVLRDALDALGVWLMQSDPHEAIVTPADLLDRLGVRPPTRKARAVDIHRAVDDMG
jgi:hypothetical protein